MNKYIEMLENVKSRIDTDIKGIETVDVDYLHNKERDMLINVYYDIDLTIDSIKRRENYYKKTLSDKIEP